ncbi:hypothetical protein GJR96_07845 [Haloferax sp. MBLA0076]|uniref:Uncharacterized protein n=1 Tax=Haloferax litoreum TaxID=2666140 RepID=A0A6A8GIB3_9EURY|nr:MULTISPECIES: hypothetical protein [Haloferax]KAB1193359.1 hypothetical protein Hfx1148_07840 [Haloferax sp. CBA1148]MRX21867.1 hypothetical protein [Haloferax litoreum]
MALLFLGLNEDRDGWDVLGKIADGEIIEDPTGELEATLKGAYDLDDEVRLREVFNNHYINAVPLAEDEE